MVQRTIPVAVMEKIMKEAGADRVSDKAKIELKKILEEKAEKIAKDAVAYSSHAGRRTIKASDIRLAASQLKYIKE